MFCMVKVWTEAALDKHISGVNEIVDLTLSCDVCDIWFRIEETMDAHSAWNQTKYEVECPDFVEMFSYTYVFSVIMHLEQMWIWTITLTKFTRV